MNVDAKKKIKKEIAKVPKHVQLDAAEQIKILKKASNLGEIENVEHMKGTDEPYYRMKFGDYRFLLFHDIPNDTVVIKALVHRQAAYKKHNLPWNK